MTNKRIKQPKRLIACLLALVCLFGLISGAGSRAYAEESGEDPSGEDPGTGTGTAVFYEVSTLPIDLSTPCELTVYPCGEGSFESDLNSATITLDLYQIATAVAVTGADTYDYSLAEAYSSLSELLEAARTMEHREEWNVFAQRAAAIIKESSGSGTAITPFLTATKAAGEDSTVIAGTSDSPFRAGLYLLVPHTDSSNYWKQDAATDPLLSWVYSELFDYYYTPQLVSLPYKREAIPTTTEPVMTSDAGGWYYGLNVYMKPEQEAYADLWIKKTLTDYHVKSNAIFVFQVDAVRDNVNIYSKAFSVLFSADVVSGVKYTVAKSIPVGATVTVKEIYQGSSCTPVGQIEYTGIMTRGGLKVDETLYQPVPFENKGSGSNGGGGIENTYTFTDDKRWNNGTPNLSPGQNSMPDSGSQSATQNDTQNATGS